MDWKGDQETSMPGGDDVVEGDFVEFNCHLHLERFLLHYFPEVRSQWNWAGKDDSGDFGGVQQWQFD